VREEKSVMAFCESYLKSDSVTHIHFHSLLSTEDSWAATVKSTCPLETSEKKVNTFYMKILRHKNKAGYSFNMVYYLR